MLKRCSINFLSLLIIGLLAGCGGIKPQEPGMGLAEKDLNWEKEKIEPGLFWYRLQNDRLFGQQQQVQMLEVGKKRKVLLSYEQNQLKTVAEFARRDSALAAVTGTFTSHPGGTSATFLKARWNIVDTASDQALTRAQTDFTEGVFAITFQDRAVIDTSRTVTYYRLADNFRDVVFAGPVLVYEGRRQDLSATEFNEQRMARTCACTTDRDRLLLLTVDGGTPQTPGMTAAELRELLLALECVNAVHLDSGQATAMWIRGKGEDGIVTRSGSGTSEVSNAIIVK
jgi:exopolysaccharide biosynthesis protein